jgi:hypothetical protein
MKNSTRSRNKLIAGLGGIAIAALLAAPGTAVAAPALTSTVLSPSNAKALGFPKTVQPAKKTKVTSQKGCTVSVEAVYEDAASKTGLVSESLQCASRAAAVKALAGARKQVKVDRSIKVPKKLGPAAFATATDAPEYLMAWIAGSRVAITAIDIDVPASTSTSTSTTVAPAPLTASQSKTLSAAALKQNSLYG